MNRFRSIAGTLAIVAFAIAVTGAVYILAGMTVSTYFIQLREATHGWGPIPGWNQPLLAAPALVVGYLAGRAALAQRQRRSVATDE